MADYEVNPKNSLFHINRFIRMIEVISLEDVEDYIEAEYFSKEVLSGLYKLDWKQISEDRLRLFLELFGNLQEVLIKFIYGLESDDPFSIQARDAKRSRVLKLKDDIDVFIKKSV